MAIILIIRICVYCWAYRIYYGNNDYKFGNMLRDFFHMATWMEPFGGIKGRKETNFPQDWTIFYWSWWLVYAPFIGLFIARISKRTSS